MTVSRVGELLYRNDDGSTRTEIVTPETLFDKQSLDTAWGKPITYLHPPGGLITSQNVAKYQKGMTQQSMLINENFLTLAGVVTDAETIEAIKTGSSVQVSAGYLTGLLERSDGLFEQINRRYNHFAVVPLGRAGEEVRIHTDGGEENVEQWRCDAVADDLELLLNDSEDRVDDKDKKEKPNVSDLIVRIDEKDQRILKDVADDVKDTITALQTRIDTLLEDLEGTEERIDELQTEKDQLQGKLDAADTRTDSSDDIGAAVQARFDAWNEVIPVVGSDKLEIDSKLTPSQIKAAAIKLINPKLNLDGKSEGYIEGLWEGIKDKGTRKTDQFLQTTPRNDSSGGKRSAVVSNYEGAYKRSRRNANN